LKNLCYIAITCNAATFVQLCAVEENSLCLLFLAKFLHDSSFFLFFPRCNALEKKNKDELQKVQPKRTGPFYTKKM